MKCKGLTLQGKPCKISVMSDVEYCRFHNKTSTVFPKPESCCVCMEPLDSEQNPLECGHWVHIECIIQSAKAECPLCRAALPRLGKSVLKKIKKLHKIRVQEQILEDEQEIQNNIDQILRSEYFQDQLDNLLANIFEIRGEYEVPTATNEDQILLHDPRIVELIQQMNSSNNYSDLVQVLNRFFE